MKKIALILIAILSIPTFAGFYPTTINTTISSVGTNEVTLKTPLSVTGMSGAVIHNYGNRLQAIVGYVAQTSGSNARTINSTAIIHSTLPNVKNKIKVGDSVIGGYLYNNILLLAPNENIYSTITRSSDKNWIHPDLYATFLSKESENSPTKANLLTFAKEYQVGLIYIVKKNTAILYDPISQKIVSKRAMENLPSDGNLPFFMRLPEIKTGIFGGKAKGNYYQIMDSIQ